MKKVARISQAFFTTLTALVLSTSSALAQGIKNPALTGELGGNAGFGVEGVESGYVFAKYFVTIWNSLNAIGALLVIFYFIWAAFEWLTSAGEKGKLEAARNKMINAVIGLIILVSLYTIIGVVSDLFFGTEFNILNPQFIDNSVTY